MGNIALGKLMLRMFIVSQFHGGLFRRPWGMYFSAKDKGEMMSMIYNWPGHLMVNKARHIMGIWLLLYCNMIVLTDGSRILGLGDLGVQGTGIPIGNLDMYVAAAGINPQRTVIERRDLGLRHPQLEGEEYLSIVDEFMEAIHARRPKFEDFQMKWAFERLQRYQKRFCMFNDDMQGTAGVALAGLLGSVRAQGRPLTNYVNQKIVVVGAGSAGLDVFNMATKAVSRMAGAEASPQFFLLDKDGLITTERKGADPAAAPFAKAPGEIKGLGLREGANLVEVVKRVKPHVLLGLSEVSGIFNEQAECTAVDAFNHAGENIVFASGSPFKNVDLGLGWELLSGAHLISDGMSQAISKCNIAAEVGAVVVRAAVAEELAEGRCDVGPKELREETVEYVKRNIWYLVYSPLVHEK
ncbi:unnamed protein product [Camellia sinensis]